MTKTNATRPEYLNEAVLVFAETTEALYRTVDAGVKKEDEQYFILIASSLNVAVAIRKLLFNDVNTENEAFMLMRPLLERLVNYHYLKAASDEERDRFFSFPYYRTFHNRHQEFIVDGTGVALHETSMNSDEIKKIPEFEHALSIFSETNNKMSWSKKSFHERVGVVAKSSEVNTGILTLVSMINYRDTSEVIHGSMYGLMMLTGIWDDGSYQNGKVTKEEAAERIAQKLTLQLCLIARLMLDTAQVLNSGEIEGNDSVINDMKLKVQHTLEEFDNAIN